MTKLSKEEFYREHDEVLRCVARGLLSPEEAFEWLSVLLTHYGAAND